MNEKPAKVLVTGGTGLLGSHLLFDLVTAGEKIRAVYRNEARLDFVKKIFGYYSENAHELFASIEWFKTDLSDTAGVVNAMSGLDAVYHCAADVTFDSTLKDKTITNNVLITKNIVDACMETGIKKLCHVSSVAAIGEGRKGVQISEQSDWDESVWHSAYAVSKHKSEEIVNEAIKNGLNAVIVNPSIIFGPGDWKKGSSVFFSSIRKGMPVYTRGVTGYVDVRDVVKAMMLLMKSDIAGRRFIVSSEDLSFYEVFCSIAENLGANKPKFYIPELLSWPVFMVMKFISVISRKRSPITEENIRSAYSYQYYDTSAIKNATGIEFIPVRDSIRDTCRIFNLET